jgi:hypothetical protein
MSPASELTVHYLRQRRMGPAQSQLQTGSGTYGLLRYPSAHRPLFSGMRASVYKRVRPTTLLQTALVRASQQWIAHRFHPVRGHHGQAIPRRVSTLAAPLDSTPSTSQGLTAWSAKAAA